MEVNSDDADMLACGSSGHDSGELQFSAEGEKKGFFEVSSSACGLSLSPTESSTCSEPRKRRRKSASPDSEGSRVAELERWVSNLERCNSVLSTSLETMTRSHATSEQREQDLRSENDALTHKLNTLNKRITSLESQLALAKDETVLARTELSSNPAITSAETSELKENLKAVTQLLLSNTNHLDSKTTQLLERLTAPVGGLASIGSRTGVLGLSSAMEAGKAPGMTPLALLGAAVAPVADAVPSQPALPTMSSILKAKPAVVSSSGLRLDFGFQFSNPRGSPATVFGVMLGLGITLVAASDPLGDPFHHPAPKPIDHVFSGSQRRLLTHDAVHDVAAATLSGRAFRCLLLLSILIGSICLSVLFSRFVAGFARCLFASSSEQEPLLPRKNQQSPTRSDLLAMWREWRADGDRRAASRSDS